MNQHQTTENNAPDILKKKIYNKPVLTILGKVTELTAGGSGSNSEYTEFNPSGKAHCNNGTVFNSDSRC